MTRSSIKMSDDVNQRAAAIVNASVSEPEAANPVHDYLSAIGRKGGLKGGKARAKKLSASKRSAIARKAAKALWAKKDVE
jgi:hypothetical protein